MLYYWITIVYDIMFDNFLFNIVYMSLLPPSNRDATYVRLVTVVIRLGAVENYYST